MPDTLRLGSSGDTVKRWQNIILVNPDGKFGPKTEAATKLWQQQHQLAADGVVGPQTWAKALGKGDEASPGTIPKVAPTAQANNDVTAYRIAVTAAPEMPEAHRQYVLAVARGEGHFGNGWKNPPKDPVALAFAKSKGLTGTEGTGSNNWGAEQGKGDAGSFPHVDFGWRNPDGTPWNGKGPKKWLPYIGTYKRHSTPEKGFLSVASTVLKGGKRGAEGAKEIQEAIESGDLKKAVYAQHANGYFELAPEKYFDAVQRNYATLTANIGWKQLLGAGTAVVGSGSLVGLVVAGLAVGAGLLWWKFKT